MSKHSRLDFLLEKNGTKIYVEAKNCTLVENNVAMFPDAVTKRGTKHLQELIDTHPDLIPGDQMGESEARKWLVVGRELGIPDSESGGSTFSADHLFIDQDGIPTIIEIKRAENTESRRKVVAQILDYAAHVCSFFKGQTIRDQTEKYHGMLGSDALIQEQFGREPDEFWSEVDRNLEDCRIRLLIVADKITPQLHRIVELLNDQMKDITILAVELRQYLGSGQKVLVPRVLGLTARTMVRKSKAKTTESQFLKNTDEYGQPVFKALLSMAKEHDLVVTWGTKGFSLSVELPDFTVPVCFAYPPNTSYHQSVQTAFHGRGGLSDKVSFPENERVSIFREPSVAELFKPKNKEWKCLIDRAFSDQQITVLLAIIKRLTKEVRERGPKQSNQ